MRRILLILTVAALMAAFLAFGSSGVAFAQDDPAVVAEAPKAKAGGQVQQAGAGAVLLFPALLGGGAGALLLRRNNKK